MKVYSISGYGYTMNIQASDRQHARAKFLNNLRKTNPQLPISEANTNITSERSLFI